MTASGLALSPELERYIAEHLRYGAAFRFTLTDTSASIREIRSVKITPRFRIDFPPVDVTILMSVSLSATMRRDEVEMGRQTFTIDVKLQALGTVQGDRYEVAPEQAELTAWWGFRPAS